MENARSSGSANAGTNLSFILLIDFQYHTASVSGKRKVEERVDMGGEFEGVCCGYDAVQ
jgi:hypothetical protein